MASFEVSKTVLPKGSETSGNLFVRSIRKAWWKLGIVAGLVIALYAVVVPPMVSDWWNDEGYSHGFLVAPLAAYIAWKRRHSILAEPASPDGRGLFLSAFACGLYLIGRLGAELFLTRASFVFLLAGLAWSFWGSRRLRLVAFPLLLLFTTVPLPQLIYNSAAAPLQLLASGVATWVSRLFGVVVYRDGNILQLATTSLGVAEACSGLRSISSLTVSALLLGYLQNSRYWARTVLFLLAIPIAIATNVVRVSGTAVLADYRPALAMGFYHSFSGWVVFMLGFGVLFIASKVLQALEKPQKLACPPASAGLN